MNNLAVSILATLNYYDILDYPLTSWEVYKFLIIPKNKLLTAKYIDILNELDNNEELRKQISVKCGFYFLKNRDILCSVRGKRTKLAEKRWRKARLILKIAASIPFLRGIFLSGSFTINNIRENSDIDLLLVTKEGRIWTTRFLISSFLSVLGQRRHGEKIEGRFCLNHYITKNFLAMDICSLYNAQTYASLIPVGCHPEQSPCHPGLDPGSHSRSIYQNNKWIDNFLCNSPIEAKHHIRSCQTKEFYVFRYLRLALEFLLQRSMGDIVERILRNVQKKYMKHNFGKNKEKGRIVLSDTILEFHPASPEAKILDIFNKRMSVLGLSEFGGQKDSGLI